MGGGAVAGGLLSNTAHAAQYVSSPIARLRGLIAPHQLQPRAPHARNNKKADLVLSLLLLRTCLPGWRSDIPVAMGEGAAVHWACRRMRGLGVGFVD